MIQRHATNRVIWHHSLSRDVTSDTIRKWHLQRGFADIGYHYVIRADGRIEQGRDTAVIGAHAKGKNADSIGICLTGDFWETRPTVWQMRAARKLYHELCDIYDKPLAIEFHRPLESPAACPGPGMNRDEFAAYIKGDQ